MNHRLPLECLFVVVFLWNNRANALICSSSSNVIPASAQLTPLDPPMQNTTAPCSSLDTLSLPYSVPTNVISPPTQITAAPCMTPFAAPLDPSQSTLLPQPLPNSPCPDTHQPSMMATDPIQNQPPALSSTTFQSLHSANESPIASLPTGFFEHTLTDLGPSDTDCSTESTIVSTPSSATGNDTKGVVPTDVPDTPASVGSRACVTLTAPVQVVAEYTAINGTWLPNIESATMAPCQNSTTSSETHVSTTAPGDSSHFTPSATEYPISWTSTATATGGDGGGIGGYIWSGLGGAPETTQQQISTPISTTQPPSNSHPLPPLFPSSDGIDTRQGNSTSSIMTIALATPLSTSQEGALTMTTRTSSPMLAAATRGATGGATVVVVTFREVVGLFGFVVVVMAFL